MCASNWRVELKTRQHKGCGSAAIQLHGLMSHSSRRSGRGSSNHIGIFEAWQGNGKGKESERQTTFAALWRVPSRMDKNSTSATAGTGAGHILLPIYATVRTALLRPWTGGKN